MIRAYFLPNGDQVFPGAQFDHDGQTYPAGWIDVASDDDLAERGIAVVLQDPPEPPDVPAEPLVPFEVTMLQACQALDAIGQLDEVEAAVKAAGGLTMQWWLRSQTMRRDSPHIAALAPLLGLSDDAIDGLFIAAALY